MRRDLWERLPERSKSVLREVRALDAQHARLSGLAPPETLAAIRGRRDTLLEPAVTFDELIAGEVVKAGSQTALAAKLGISQARISAWSLGGSRPAPARMRLIVEQLGYRWEDIKGDMLDPAPQPSQVTVAPRSLTVRIPAHLQGAFGVEDDVPERVRRLAWEAAAGAFQAVIRSAR
jgi:transcriptional regulator with XRE-family HTH domain